MAQAPLAGPSTRSKSGHSKKGDGQTYSTLATIDDTVSFIRSNQPPPISDVLNEQGSERAKQDMILTVLLPTLTKAFEGHKGNGKKMFAKKLQDGIDPLQMLDPSLNTLGYTFVLGARCSSAHTAEEAQALVPYVAQFAQVASPEQWFRAGEIVTVLAQGIVNVASIIDDLVWAIPSLTRILDAFRLVNRGLHNLTTIHTIVLYHLLRTAHYETAFDWIVQHDIVSASSSVSPLHYTDVLQYFYYGGLVCTKIGDYERACEMFEQCVCCPAQAVSAIHIDAYKKLILLQLLHKGKISALPAYASVQVQRAIRGKVSHIDAYHAFAKAFCREPALQLGDTATNFGLDDTSLHKIVQQNVEVYMRDTNLGLVKRLSDQQLRRRLQRLSELFTRITMQNIVKLLLNDDGANPNANANKLDSYRTILHELRQAHAAGWVQVSFEDARGLSLNTEADPSDLTSAIVCFGRTNANYSSPESVQHLIEVMQESQRWNDLVHEKERQIAQSEAYLTKTSHSKQDRALVSNLDDDEDDAFA